MSENRRYPAHRRVLSLARVGVATAVVTVGLLAPLRLINNARTERARAVRVLLAEERRVQENATPYQDPRFEGGLGALGIQIVSIEALSDEIEPRALGELTQSIATDINDQSQIVGFAFDSDGQSIRGFSVKNRKGSLLPNPPGGNNNLASGVNNAGAIVGISDANGMSGARWGSKNETLGYDGYPTQATAIDGKGNAYGVIAGDKQDSLSYTIARTKPAFSSMTEIEVLQDDPANVPALYRVSLFGVFPLRVIDQRSPHQAANELTGLMWPAGSGKAKAAPGILPLGSNEKGTVAGLAIVKDSFVPIIIDGDKRTRLPLVKDIAHGAAYAVNGKGQAVGIGISEDGRSGIGLAWTGGKASMLPGLGGFAMGRDIANNGDIVGVAAVGEEAHAVIWRGGKIVDLNKALPPDSGWVLMVATGINNKGQIVGWGMKDDTVQAFALQIKQ